ncbi:Uu.00g121510.m01.CDS01 [Anthostomella pinea]|uniref:Uu.00g121510.m01.CDS01 n=1 Tax=Anthostomella pinea TaxID=933095 RepID=A0AAI8YHG2_9PEZI|nr:Uu.00g121510.m01.CDS01 [Anthostomella pinea]
MFSTPKFEYSSLPSAGEQLTPDDERHHFVDDLEKLAGESLRPGLFHRTIQRARIYTPSVAILIPWSLVLLCVWRILYWEAQGPNELECTRLLNPYSPLIEEGLVEYYDTNFDNEFAHKTEYRGPPTPDIEVAWNRLWNRGAVEVPVEGLAKLNKSGDLLKHAHFDPNRGYSSILEAFHQLHCLNLIRQFTWRDYYYEHLQEWLAMPENQRMVDLNVSDHRSVGDRMHVDHCIETLRLQLMCNADVTPLLILLDDSSEHGTAADFNTHHKCRNWDKLLDWQDKHNTDDEPEPE